MAETLRVIDHRDIGKRPDRPHTGTSSAAVRLRHSWPTVGWRAFDVAAEANTALIVQVKDNQPTLNQKIQTIASTTVPIDAVGSRTRGRNRDERRILKSNKTNTICQDRYRAAPAGIDNLLEVLAIP